MQTDGVELLSGRAKYVEIQHVLFIQTVEESTQFFYDMNTFKTKPH